MSGLTDLASGDNTVNSGNSRLLQITEVVKQVVGYFGFKNFRLENFPGRTALMFAITNQGMSTDDRWRRFPVIIEITESLIITKTIFTMRNECYKFNDTALLKIILEFIAKANSGLQIGFFNYSSHRRQLIYDCKGYIQEVEERMWPKLVENLLLVNISTYKAYIYGIVNIVDKFPQGIQPDINALIRDCEGRMSNWKDKKSLMQKHPEKPKPSPNPKQTLSSEHSGSTRFLDQNEMLYFRTKLENEEFQKELKVLKEVESRNLKDFCEFQGLQVFQEERKIKYFVRAGLLLPEALRRSANSVVILAAVKALICTCLSKGLVFTEFPESNILITHDFNAKIIPFYLSQKAQIINASPEELTYSMHSLMNGMQAFLLKQINLANDLQFEISDADYIPAKELKVKNVFASDLAIGKGGFAYVFKNELFGMTVALKAFNVCDSNREKIYSHLKKEITLMKSFVHENVISCYGYTKYEGRPILILEYAQNQSLDHYLRRYSISFDQKLSIIIKITQALEYLHSRSVCHFDIKPHNILLTDTLEPKLCDFGLSEYINQYKKKRPGFTLIYSSPEQITGNMPTFKSDIWSLGMTIYHALVGKQPYDYLMVHGVKMEKKRFYKEITDNKRTPTIDESFENAHTELVNLLREMWSLDPEKRPSASEVRRRLITLSSLNIIS